MIKSPCKDCGNRYLGCHSECGKYTLYKRKCNLESSTIRKKKYENYLFYYKSVFIIAEDQQQQEPYQLRL